MKLARLLVFLFLCGTLSARAQLPPNVGTVTPFEENNHFTTLKQLDTFIHTLKGQGVWKVSVESAGTSSVRHLPIWSVHLVPNAPRMRVMILARVHGNEPASTEALLAFMRDVVSDSGDRAPAWHNYEFLMLPCVNPEGADRAAHESEESDGWWGEQGRDNDAHEDINRDYLRLSTAEARTVVDAYDRFKPQIVVDMHEYESRPLVSGTDGWWRAEYWDFLIGAGRAPWAPATLRRFCRSEAEDVLFSSLAQSHIRAEHYMLPSGNFDSSMHFASNAADYFLVRGSAAFLFESAGGDEGEGSAGKRIHCHRVALETLLSDVAAHPDRLSAALAAVPAEQAQDRRVALTVKGLPQSVKVMGTSSQGVGFDGKIDVATHTYHTHAIAHFEGLDYNVTSSAALPSAFIIQTRDADYLRLLALHGVPMVAAARDFTMNATPYPAGTVVVTASTPLVGLLLLKEVQDLTPNHLPSRGVVTPAPAGFQAPDGKPIVTAEDCVSVMRQLPQAGGGE